MGAMKYWLCLSGQKGISCRARAAIVRYYRDAESAFFAPGGEFEKIPGLTKLESELLEKRDLSHAERILADCQRLGIELITMQDARYPKRLKYISDPPVLLYVKGKLPDVDNVPALAIIGTRKATPYGIKMGRKLSYETAKSGGTVISLLTEGIDREAARGCLLADGSCIAVLGTGIDRLNSIQRDIITNGALVSEYPPNMPTQKHFYRERNRIASGLSHGVIVVEAPEKSGTLLFAAEALEQGREVFAVPGNADAINSVGTIELIKQGAKPVTCGWDALEEFEYLFPNTLKRPGGEIELPPMPPEREEKTAPKAKAQETTIKDVDKQKSEGYIDLREQLSGLDEEQLKIISAIEGDSTHVDDIIVRTGLSTAKVLSQLTLLEIKGFIRRSAGRRVSLNISKIKVRNNNG